MEPLSLAYSNDKEALKEKAAAPRGVATVIAYSAQLLGFQVTSSHALHSNVVEGTPQLRSFEHVKCCEGQSTENGLNFVEHLKDGETHLHFEYDRDPLRFGGSTTLRVLYTDPVTRVEKRLTKPIPSRGATAFRNDSFLSFLSYMCGSPDWLQRTNLPKGALAPALYTDAKIRAGVYAYGTLESARPHGQGKWQLESREVDVRLRNILNTAVVTVLEVVNARAGPNGSNAQWAKSGFHPSDCRVVGCIVSAELEEYVSSLDVAHQVIFDQYLSALECPWRYLKPECATYLLRYAIAGLPLAYYERALYYVLVEQKSWDMPGMSDAQKLQSAADQALKQMASFLRDDHNAYPAELRAAVRHWLVSERVHLTFYGGAMDIHFMLKSDFWDQVNPKAYETGQIPYSESMMAYLRLCHSIIMDGVGRDASRLGDGDSEYTLTEHGQPMPAVGTKAFQDAYGRRRKVRKNRIFLETHGKHVQSTQLLGRAVGR